MLQKPLHNILWCDAEANCRRLSEREGVIDLMDKAKHAGIDTLIIDVKPLGGEVLYRSKLAPRLGEVNGLVYPESFDLLQTAIEEGHKHGLQIHAAINVFSEGHRAWERGPAYDHPEWQTFLYEVTRTLTFSSGLSVAVERVDPWTLPADESALYTRAGKTVETTSERSYVIIVGECVSQTCRGLDAELVVPKSGCVLVLPPGMSGESISRGDTVGFSSEQMFRRAGESKVPSWGIFVDPLGPARSYELQIVQEIVSSYDVDGIVFDRMRYPNLYGDFSETSRREFENALGKGSLSWPNDIYRINDIPWLPPIQGKYYKEWLEWRSSIIRDFAEEAVNLVHKTKPEVQAGVYVGSWYDSYFDVGVNWGSNHFHPHYDWMTETYNQTGYAELFDYICTGCYYPQATREDARKVGRPEGATVEAACELSRRAIGDAAPVYGGLYLKEYAGNPDMFKKSVRTAVDCSDGVMLFDLVYLEEYHWWPILKESFSIR